MNHEADQTNHQASWRCSFHSFLSLAPPSWNSDGVPTLMCRPWQRSGLAWFHMQPTRDFNILFSFEAKFCSIFWTWFSFLTKVESFFDSKLWEENQFGMLKRGHSVASAFIWSLAIRVLASKWANGRTNDQMTIAEANSLIIDRGKFRITNHSYDRLVDNIFRHALQGAKFETLAPPLYHYTIHIA